MHFRYFIIVDNNQISSLPFFFIIGRPRSGTTLLRTLLDAHPNVIIPHESPVILNLFNRYIKKVNWSEKDIRNFYNDLKSQHIFSHWNINENELFSSLLECKGEFTYQGLIKVLYSRFTSVYKKKNTQIIGDKNPVYSYNFNRLFPIFPNARIIHITRDYRDQIVSMKKMDFEMPDPALMAYRWKISVKEISAYTRKYPNQFYSLKYEDLVSDPEMKMTEVCNFLGIEYKKEILDFHTIENVSEFLPVEAMNKFHSSLLNPISVKKVNSWKTNLSNKEIKIADFVVGEYAERSGYSRNEKSPFGLYILPSIPFLLYGWIWSFSRKLVPYLPFFIKKRIWKISPKLPRYMKGNFKN
ncbi:MAG: sulfotransferase [Bacteroidales bacterium]